MEWIDKAMLVTGVIVIILLWIAPPLPEPLENKKCVERITEVGKVTGFHVETGLMESDSQPIIYRCLP